MPIELIKLLPEGATAVALIVIVWLFLQQQAKNSLFVKELLEKTIENERSILSYSKLQLDEAAHRTAENQKLFQEHMQKLMDTHLAVANKIIESIGALINRLQSK